MSNEKNTGGPAFPVAGEIMIERSPGEPYPQGSMGMGPQEGMTLRDYFAAKAMNKAIDLWPGQNFTMVAGFCYDIADAMLKARNS